MPFWKKSEDPWDCEPEKPPRPAAPGPEDKDYAPSLMDELREWNEERKEKKRQREATPAPMACPWCGQEMEVGYITGGRDTVQWWPGWPPQYFTGVGDGKEVRVDHEGTVFHRYKAAWLCRACRRMVLEFPEEEVALPQSGWWNSPADNRLDEETQK